MWVCGCVSVWGTLCPPLFWLFYFLFFNFFCIFVFFYYIYIYIYIAFFYLKFFFVLLFFIFLIISKLKKTIKKNTAFWGLQICPSSIEFMSVTNGSNEMK